MTAPAKDSVAGLDFTPTCEVCPEAAVWFLGSCHLGFFACTWHALCARDNYNTGQHFCPECSRLTDSFGEAFPKVVLLP